MSAARDPVDPAARREPGDLAAAERARERLHEEIERVRARRRGDARPSRASGVDETPRPDAANQATTSRRAARPRPATTSSAGSARSRRQLEQAHRSARSTTAPTSSSGGIDQVEQPTARHAEVAHPHEHRADARRPAARDRTIAGRDPSGRHGSRRRRPAQRSRTRLLGRDARVRLDLVRHDHQEVARSRRRPGSRTRSASSSWSVARSSSA